MYPTTASTASTASNATAARRPAPGESFLTIAEPVSPEQVEAYLAEGRRLRAEAMRNFFLAAKAAGARLFTSSERAMAPSSGQTPDFLATVAGRLRTPLTSIRSSAEILRDNPDLPVEQRNRFLDMVIDEDKRLARLVDAILDASEVEANKRRWQIRTDPLEKQLA
ncbi:MAG: hypothetical protein MI920_16395 [Kiloniellales bacterium]|nr:hypothetical protein [Kiloniellales bacterium]